MGLVRLLLATLVLASHAKVIPLYTGTLAVECFFVISGFYMQMILSERYAGQPHWKRRFWASRLLRIFVPYWIILGIIILANAGIHYYNPDKAAPLWTLWMNRPFSLNAILSLFSNLLILGTETIKLVRISEGCDYLLWYHIVIKPVWSVGIELMFYAIAPFLLLRSSNTLFSIVLASVIGRVILYDGHIESLFGTAPCADSVLVGLFPLELGTFLIGALCYRMYKAFLEPREELRSNRAYQRLLILILAGVVLVCYGLDHLPMLSFQLFLLFFILFMPFLFAASRLRPGDRAVGDLSYPFYLWHYFILTIVQKLGLGNGGSFLLAWIVTVLAAWLVMYYIEEPLSRFRHRYLRRHAPPQA